MSEDKLYAENTTENITPKRGGNNMRKDFEMTEAQLDKLKESFKPVPAMFLSGGQPMFGTVQDNANRAWQSLGDELGFVWDSVQPNGKGDRFFSAEVKEAK